MKKAREYFQEHPGEKQVFHWATIGSISITKWKLVKWTKKGKEKDIMAGFKTDQIYQVFNEKNKFISINGEKQNKGRWKLSKENDVLTIISGIFVVDFHIDYFDAKKRVITSDQMGTLEYTKVE